jgi:hypothetical protein
VTVTTAHLPAASAIAANAVVAPSNAAERRRPFVAADGSPFIA